MSISTENGDVFFGIPHPSAIVYDGGEGHFLLSQGKSNIDANHFLFGAQFISSNCNGGSGRSSGNLSISPCLLLQPITAQSLCHFILSF
jgi:hypothetical protein